MLLINCPWCGERPETEFRYGGQAHLARPSNPAELDDQAWAAFLFVRSNPRGLYAERWNHQHGCQRWFNVRRNTYTDAFVEPDEAASPSRENEAPGQGNTGAER